MRKLLDKLNQRPLTIHEACEALKNPETKKGPEKRMVEIYFAELKALGIVTYDPKAKLYELAGIRKRVFKSKHDYELAIRHSEKFLFTTEEVQLFDQMDPYCMVDVLAFQPGVYAPLESHLKTGYFNEIWMPLEKYRAMMKQYDYPEIRVIPEAGWLPIGYGPDYGKPRYHIPQDEGGWGVQSIGHGLGSTKAIKEIPKKVINKLEELKHALIKEMYFVMGQVKHGVPLKGYCDYCPDRRLTIKEGAE